MKNTGVFSKVFWSGGSPILRYKISPHLDCNAKIYSLHRRGLYLIRKRYLFPTPFWKIYFFPLSRHIIFWVPRDLFALILPYFAIILPFTFLFSHFLSPFFIFLSPFFLFFYIFPLFLFAFSYFSPQKTSGRYFPIYRPLLHNTKRFDVDSTRSGMNFSVLGRENKKSVIFSICAPVNGKIRSRVLELILPTL
jgi:hypothetical protein